MTKTLIEMLCDYLGFKNKVKLKQNIFDHFTELKNNGNRDNYEEYINLDTYEVEQYFWDESHHNGDHYNQFQLVKPLQGDALDRFQGILEGLAIEKSNDEEEEKAKLEKERKDWDILVKKLVGMP
jgi:hypothetical protein